MNRLITITEERLNKAKTPKGGFRNAQFSALGLKLPPPKGWKKDLIGSRVTLRRFIAFVAAGKNQHYLGEIMDILPTLTPPVVDPLKATLDIISEKSKPKKKLNKGQTKKEKRDAKRVETSAEREQRIREFGIHCTIRLLFEKAGASISFQESKFMNSLLSKSESTIPSCDVMRLYRTLKKHGVILSRRANGNITPSGFTSISHVRREQLLYVIRAKNTDYLKIGISKNPKSRKKELQTSNPNSLSIAMVFVVNMNAVKLEKILHKNFSNKWKQGEWFESVSDDEIIQCIGERAVLTKDY